MSNCQLFSIGIYNQNNHTRSILSLLLPFWWQSFEFFFFFLQKLFKLILEMFKLHKKPWEMTQSYLRILNMFSFLFLFFSLETWKRHHVSLHLFFLLVELLVHSFKCFSHLSKIVVKFKVLKNTNKSFATLLFWVPMQPPWIEQISICSEVTWLDSVEHCNCWHCIKFSQHKTEKNTSQ